MKCKHEVPIRQLMVPPYRGVTMPIITLRCGDCYELLSLGPSSDDIPWREQRLAEKLAVIDELWETGIARDEMIEMAVDDCAEIE